jgi:hypothetical protein
MVGMGSQGPRESRSVDTARAREVSCEMDPSPSFSFVIEFGLTYERDKQRTQKLSFQTYQQMPIHISVALGAFEGYWLSADRANGCAEKFTRASEALPIVGWSEIGVLETGVVEVVTVETGCDWFDTVFTVSMCHSENMLDGYDAFSRVEVFDASRRFEGDFDSKSGCEPIPSDTSAIGRSPMAAEKPGRYKSALIHYYPGLPEHIVKPLESLILALLIDLKFRN